LLRRHRETGACGQMGSFDGGIATCHERIA